MAALATRSHVDTTRTGISLRGELLAILRAMRSPYPYLLALAALAAVTLVYQWPQRVTVRIGGGYDAPFLRGFYEPTASGDPAFRWASSRARIVLPGVGARDSTLVITASPRPDGMTDPVTIVVNGITLGEFVPSGAPRDYTFPLPARDFSYGNLTVDLLSKGQPIVGRGAEPLFYGPRVDRITIEPGVSPTGVKPPPELALAWVLATLLLYLLLGRVGTGDRAATTLAIAFLLALVAATTARRLDLALFAPRVAFLLAAAYLLTIVAGYTLPRLFALAGIQTSPRVWRLLLLLFLFVYLLKLGGIAYPQLIVIDQPWHDQQFQKVLLGRFWELYRPSNTGISGIPGQWGINAQIPYSPFLYLLGLPFYLWPVGRDLSINFWSGLFDTSRVFIVFFLARLLGARERGALFAAFIIGLTPSTFLLHSWGNYPTTISQYAVLVFLTVLVATWSRLRQPRVFIALTLLLTLAMLLYTVTAVFIGLLLVLLVAWLAWRGKAEARGTIMPLMVLLVASSVAAFALYYVQYVGPLVRDTLPAFRAELAAGRSLGGASPPLQQYVARYIGNLWAYGVVLSLGIAPVGWYALTRRARHPLAAPLLGAWFTVFVFFAIAGFKIDMVSKELWFVLPAVAICAGVACDSLLTRWRPRFARLAVGLYLAQLTAAAIMLWMVRIIAVRH